MLAPGPNYITRLLVSDALFKITEITLRSDDYLLPKLPKPQIIAVVQGALTVNTDADPVRLNPGEFCLIPAELRTAKLTALTPVTVLHVDVA